MMLGTAIHCDPGVIMMILQYILNQLQYIMIQVPDTVMILQYIVIQVPSLVLQLIVIKVPSLGSAKQCDPGAIIG